MCRRAYELAFASAYMFAGQRPIFKEIDEVTFKRPVDIGDLLRLTSSILHTQPSTQDPNKVAFSHLCQYRCVLTFSSMFPVIYMACRSCIYDTPQGKTYNAQAAMLLNYNMSICGADNYTHRGDS